MPRDAVTVIGAEGERDRRRDRRAEDQQQDDQQEGDRDQLGPLGRADRLLLDRPREAGETGLGRGDGRRDPFLERRGRDGGPSPRPPPRRRRGSRRGSALARARAKAVDAAAGPMARASRPPDRLAARGSAPVPAGRAGPAGPRSRIAKGAVSPKWRWSRSLAARGVGARDVERGGPELLVDSLGEHGKGGDRHEGHREHGAGTPQRERRAPLLAAGPRKHARTCIPGRDQPPPPCVNASYIKRPRGSRRRRGNKLRCPCTWRTVADEVDKRNGVETTPRSGPSPTLPATSRASR